MASDLWITLTTQISASGMTAALIYLDARITLQANGANVFVANCLQACGKGKRGDLALVVRAGAVTARGAAQLAMRTWDMPSSFDRLRMRAVKEKWASQ